jgi:hypothetical protein
VVAMIAVELTVASPQPMIVLKSHDAQCGLTTDTRRMGSNERNGWDCQRMERSG